MLLNCQINTWQKIDLTLTTILKPSRGGLADTKKQTNNYTVAKGRKWPLILQLHLSLRFISQLHLTILIHF